jgi:hypothetical protein
MSGYTVLHGGAHDFAAEYEAEKLEDAYFS